VWKRKESQAKVRIFDGWARDKAFHPNNIAGIFKRFILE
jgi:hypothetical protein